MNQAEQLKQRTKKFAIDVVKLFDALPNTTKAQVLGTQLLRAAMSTAANYRAACRARSKAEFAAKIGLVVEEADEAVFFLEVLPLSGVVPARATQHLAAEANELVSIFVCSYRTSKS